MTAIAVALAVGMGGATAQAQNATNETTVEGTPVDEDLTLTDWEFSDGTFTLTFDLQGERPKTVTVAESTQPGEGTQASAIRRERLLPGENTITLTTRTAGGEAAAAITTSDSIDAGRQVTVSTGQTTGENPFAPFGGTSGVLSGVGLSMLMSGGAAAWVLRSEENGVIKA
ncbi:hypothetical protein C479_11320 [Halovivax asiaticus JCM 14624]|uniref:Uncharacterized protein n=2 Tax=Halovivax asiaticus TaxID=332953 RepID=M0BET8_9EURY|nr:hypothetical protein C479_11320 [Halovivax asiaticus JCM 14624]